MMSVPPCLRGDCRERERDTTPAVQTPNPYRKRGLALRGPRRSRRRDHQVKEIFSGWWWRGGVVTGWRPADLEGGGFQDVGARLSKPKAQVPHATHLCTHTARRRRALRAAAPPSVSKPDGQCVRRECGPGQTVVKREACSRLSPEAAAVEG
jgi:hypothetical protein